MSIKLVACAQYPKWDTTAVCELSSWRESLWDEINQNFKMLPRTIFQPAAAAAASDHIELELRSKSMKYIFAHIQAFNRR